MRGLGFRRARFKAPEPMVEALCRGVVKEMGLLGVTSFRVVSTISRGLGGPLAYKYPHDCRQISILLANSRSCFQQI